jgi:hypothetical protein
MARMKNERPWFLLGAAVLIFCAATLLVLNYPQATPVSELEQKVSQSASAKGLHNGKSNIVKKNLSSISKKEFAKDDSTLSSEGKSIAKEEITVDKLSTQLFHAQKKLNDLSRRRLKVLIPQFSTRSLIRT